MKSIGGKHKQSECLGLIFLTLFYNAVLHDWNFKLMAKICECSAYGILHTDWQFIPSKKCLQFTSFWRTFADSWTQSRLICSVTLPDKTDS